ncbi:nucleotidyltransferase family protein [uncultured Chryseobacterium sp.]|uniref:nucleotidyltransferase family protein n=1 Tax=uncultured Chryseobacterium sp. TaxID=259322 RepID=UPI0025F85CCD|nr:nucleotidyltransferase family protein [uncultured Chryseobacterium sp.]
MEGRKTGIIILAAGNSSRLGQPKQLLPYRGKTLLRQTIEEALAVTSCVIVVTGNENTEIEREAGTVMRVRNGDWEEGMSSSIRTGLQAMQQCYPETQQYIFTVCDQPHISAAVFLELIRKEESSGKGIIASAYSGALGTPVLFSTAYDKRLSGLSGQEGARKLILRHPEDTEAVVFEKGSVDIDTIEDYKKLISKKE